MHVNFLTFWFIHFTTYMQKTNIMPLKHTSTAIAQCTLFLLRCTERSNEHLLYITRRKCYKVSIKAIHLYLYCINILISLSPSCHGQKIPKGLFGFWVNLPPAHLTTAHTQWRLCTVPFFAEHKTIKKAVNTKFHGQWFARPEILSQIKYTFNRCLCWHMYGWTNPIQGCRYMLFVIYRMFVIRKIAKIGIKCSENNKLPIVTFRKLSQKIPLLSDVRYL